MRVKGWLVGVLVGAMVLGLAVVPVPADHVIKGVWLSSWTLRRADSHAKRAEDECNCGFRSIVNAQIGPT